MGKNAQFIVNFILSDRYMLLFHVLFQKLIDSTFGKETRATNQSADMKTYTFFFV